MLGEKAALAIISGASDVVFGFNEGKVVAVNLFEAVNNTKTLNPELVRLARVWAGLESVIQDRIKELLPKRVG